MMKKLMTALIAAAGLSGAALAEDTIKVGVILPEGGPFSTLASQVFQSAELAMDTLNASGGALGRKYEIVKQGYSGTPAAFVQAATKLAQQDGVSFLQTLSATPLSAALSPKLAALNSLYIDTSSAHEDLVGKNCQPNFFRLSNSDGMMVNVVRAAVKGSGLKTWNALIADYSAGHEFAQNFAKVVEEAGGTVQVSLFAPLGTTDFGSFISQLSARPAEGLMVAMPGVGGTMLVKQQQQFGLFDKYKSVLSAYVVTEMTLTGIGDAALGVYSILDYSWDQPGALNAAFVKAFETRYKRKPTFLDANNYAYWQVLHAAITRAKSTDVAAVRAALSGQTTPTIVGNIELRAQDHQAVRSMVLGQAVKGADGKPTVAMRTLFPGDKITPPPTGACKF